MLSCGRCLPRLCKGVLPQLKQLQPTVVVISYAQYVLIQHIIGTINSTFTQLIAGFLLECFHLEIFVLQNEAIFCFKSTKKVRIYMLELYKAPHFCKHLLIGNKSFDFVTAITS